MRIPGIFIGNSVGNSWSSYWTPLKDAATKAKFLYGGKISQISGGEMPSLLDSDHIDVGGSAGSYTFQVPNTAPYQNADSDYIFFTSATVRRTTTEAELVGYDFSKTFVKYLDYSPYSIQEVWILKSGETLTTDEENNMRTYCHLSKWWNNVLSNYGAIKQNRGIGQLGWLPDAPTNLVCSLDGHNIKIDFDYGLTIGEGYKIERSTTDETNYAVVHTNTLATKTWTDTTVIAATKYYYRVKVYLGTGYSAYSASDNATTPAATTLLNNLVGYWKLDEASGNAIDSVTPGGHDGTPANVTQNVAGKISKAVQFTNISGCKVDMGSIGGISVNTVSIWAKRATQTQTTVLFGRYSAYSSIGCDEAGNVYLIGSDGAPDATWNAVWADKTAFHHIVVKVSVSGASGAIELIFDNVSQGVVNCAIEHMDRLILGACTTDGFSFAGVIDEVGLWSRALTTDEVTELNNSGNGKTYPF